MPRPRSHTPTQAAIADAAGVSIPTVSKALRGHRSISPHTRDRIRSVARQLGYPLPLDGSEEEGSHRPRVTALFDSINNAYASNLMEGMISSAAQLGITLQVDHLGVLATSLSQEEAHTRIEAVISRVLRSADGIILVTMTVDEQILQACQAHRIPVITIDPATTPPPSLVTLASTNWRGSKEATEHLLSLGHTRIAVAAGPTTSVPTVDRIAGYRSALAQAGLPYDPALVLHGSYTYAAGQQAAQALLDSPTPPTAILALSDLLAVGILDTARQRGVEVPAQLSVVGFDDTQIAALAVPPLTCIHQPLHEMGAEALQLMSRAIDLGHVPGLPVELRTSLVIRSSTASAPAR